MVYFWKFIRWILLVDIVYVRLGIFKVFYGFYWVNIMLFRDFFSIRCFLRILWILLGDIVYIIFEVFIDKLFLRSFMDFNGRYILRYF